MKDESQEIGLIGGIEKRAIKIAPYDRHWPEISGTHEIILAKALGSAALRIEHIGSTSVSGLGAAQAAEEIYR